MSDPDGVTDSPWWTDRVLVALEDAEAMADETALLRAVAVRFADRFGPGDRVYEANTPRWHSEVLAAFGRLEAAGLAGRDGGPHLLPVGRDSVAAARERLASAPAPSPAEESEAAQGGPGAGLLPMGGVIAPPLRGGHGADESVSGPVADVAGPVMVELNLRHRGGPQGAFAALELLWAEVTGGSPVERLAEEYATGSLTMGELKRLVAADAVPIQWPDRAVYRVWPDFPVKPQIDTSVVTVKADAGHRAFNAVGAGIVWAVIDSGIEGSHPHFQGYSTLKDPAVSDLHRSFTPAGQDNPADALIDEDGHGTHVAGIIAGGLAGWEGEAASVLVTESRYNVEDPQNPLRLPRQLEDPKVSLAGVAPRTLLVSLKVLGGGGTLENRVSRLIQALTYVREVNAGSELAQRIHGVNLSVGYDFRMSWFACGASPLCQAVNKLVRSGVVVVVAAGNSGFGSLNVTGSDVTEFSLANTINDPGNAQDAITVGSTHRDAPHTYGVSYFSSKGPTADGRMKPDLVAPGERITSAAAGHNLQAVSVPPEMTKPAVYVEDSGTSMAAPHVSGVAAAFLSVRREFIGKPDQVKEVLIGSATSLHREPAFQGAGLVDLMRALQSV